MDRRFLIVSVLVPLAIAVACLFFYISLRHTSLEPVDAQVEDSFALLVSIDGEVMVRRSSQTGWKSAQAGAQLTRGDWIFTRKSSKTLIEYNNGTKLALQPETFFSVQDISDSGREIDKMPLSARKANLQFTPAAPEIRQMPEPAPALAPAPAPALAPAPESSEEPRELPQLTSKAEDERPFFELQQVVPFGRSLELIGNVEPGSRLAINDEAVEVEGDGSFKHFTKQFSASIRVVRLVMKTTDLAGRTRVLTATYDFGTGELRK